MPDEAPKLTPVRGHMTLDPAGIDVFAALMHCVFAHVGNPSRVGDAAHFQNSVKYIAAHTPRGVEVHRELADAASVTYYITHPRKPVPLHVRILIGRPAAECLEVRSGDGWWVPISLADFAIRSA